MNNINNRFGAQRQYPGATQGLSLEQVKEKYILNRKIYGQVIACQVGATYNQDINMPSDGRELIGISLYFNYATGADNPQLNLQVNNSTFINSVGIRQFDIANIQEAMYYPINLPLSGQDNIKLDILNSANASNLFINFHYV